MRGTYFLHDTEIKDDNSDTPEMLKLSNYKISFSSSQHDIYNTLQFTNNKAFQLKANLSLRPQVWTCPCSSRRVGGGSLCE